VGNQEVLCGVGVLRRPKLASDGWDRPRWSTRSCAFFVESAVDEIVAWRMAKAQQMRWSRATVQPFLDMRTAVLNGTLKRAFRRRHPGFRPVNDNPRLIAAVV
jgi:hypothetical protein